LKVKFNTGSKQFNQTTAKRHKKQKRFSRLLAKNIRKLWNKTLVATKCGELSHRCIFDCVRYQ